MKIIVSDFDLSFYDNDFLSNINLVNNLVDAGNIFLIATGRSLIQLKDIIDRYQIKCSYYICNDGGVIYDSGFKEIYRKDIEIECSKEIFNIMNSSNKFTTVLIDTSHGYVSVNSAKANCIIGKIIERKEAGKILNTIMNRFPSVHGYISSNWLSITDRSVSKGSAIKFLCAKNNWSSKSVYTIGDNINDISMFENYDSYLIKNKYHEMEFSGATKVNSFKEAIDKIEGN